MNEEKYGELLREIRPRLIDSAEEHERLLSVAESMMEKGDSLSEEEREALALIVLLIEAFESQILDESDDESEDADDEDEAPPSPHVALQRLMGSHNLEIGDIAPIFGTPHQAREVLEGKRPISKNQAKELARYFSVPPKLFQE
jgi:HTH-type transcriptional regulator/antitoxin HigA